MTWQLWLNVLFLLFLIVSVAYGARAWRRARQQVLIDFAQQEGWQLERPLGQPPILRGQTANGMPWELRGARRVGQAMVWRAVLAQAVPLLAVSPRDTGSVSSTLLTGSILRTITDQMLTIDELHALPGERGAHLLEAYRVWAGDKAAAVDWLTTAVRDQLIQLHLRVPGQLLLLLSGQTLKIYLEAPLTPELAREIIHLGSTVLQNEDGREI